MPHRNRLAVMIAMLTLLLTGSAFAAAVDYFITAVNGDGIVSARAATQGAASVSFKVLDAKVLGKLKAGEKISIDSMTGQASMQDFHFNVMLIPAVRPSAKTTMAVPMQQNNAPRSVMINGKLLTSRARMADGSVFVPLQDFSAALGNSLTLEPTLKLEFPRLSTVGPSGGAQSQKVNTALKYEAPTASHKVEAGYTVKLNDKVRGFQVMNVNKAGVISNRLRKIDGQVYVPLNDILIGLSVDPTKQNMTAPSLNFSVPANANALIGLL